MNLTHPYRWVRLIGTLLAKIRFTFALFRKWCPNTFFRENSIRKIPTASEIINSSRLETMLSFWNVIQYVEEQFKRLSKNSINYDPSPPCAFGELNNLILKVFYWVNILWSRKILSRVGLRKSYFTRVPKSTQLPKIPSPKGKIWNTILIEWASVQGVCLVKRARGGKHNWDVI